jgi:hypothetical protein
VRLRRRGPSRTREARPDGDKADEEETVEPPSLGDKRARLRAGSRGRARRLEGAHRLVEVGARRRPLAACGEHDQIGGPTQATTVRLLGSAGSRPPAT